MPRIKAATLPQKKIFEHVLLFTGSEWSVTNAASYFVIDGLRPGFGLDQLVHRAAAWTLEQRKRARISHDCPPTGAFR
jgi:hypothetical protein